MTYHFDYYKNLISYCFASQTIRTKRQKYDLRCTGQLSRWDQQWVAYTMCRKTRYRTPAFWKVTLHECSSDRTLCTPWSWPSVAIRSRRSECNRIPVTLINILIIATFSSTCFLTGKSYTGKQASHVRCIIVMRRISLPLYSLFLRVGAIANKHHSIISNIPNKN